MHIFTQLCCYELWNKTIRILSGKYTRESYPLFKTFGILTLPSIYILEILKFVKLCLFVSNADHHEHTRNRTFLRTNIGSHFMKYVYIIQE